MRAHNFPRCPKKEPLVNWTSRAKGQSYLSECTVSCSLEMKIQGHYGQKSKGHGIMELHCPSMDPMTCPFHVTKSRGLYFNGLRFNLRKRGDQQPLVPSQPGMCEAISKRMRARIFLIDVDGGT